jgi:hypothetical protein
MTLDKKSEEQLDRFLKSNRPIPPEPRAGEFRSILSRIEQQKRHHLWWKIAIPAAVAASIALLIFVPSSRQENHINVAQVELETFLEETLGTFYGGNGYGNADLMIGDDWLEIVE